MNNPLTPEQKLARIFCDAENIPGISDECNYPDCLTVPDKYGNMCSEGAPWDCKDPLAESVKQPILDLIESISKEGKKNDT